MTAHVFTIPEHYYTDALEQVMSEVRKENPGMTEEEFAALEGKVRDSLSRNAPVVATFYTART